MSTTADITAPSPTVSVDAECRGTAYEMGVAQGKAVAGKVRGALAAVSQLEAFRLAKPFWLPFGLFRRIAERRAREYVTAALHDAPHQSELLRGIIDGAGVRGERLHLANVLEIVLSDLTDSTYVPVTGACSAVAFSAAVMNGTGPLVAHNFDYLPLVQPFYVVRRRVPNDGLRSLEFTVAPLCGTVDGINEAGLCITYNYAFVTDKGPPGPTISMLIADALAQCRRVDEAAERIAGATPRSGGGILTLADASGETGILELSNTRSDLRRKSSECDGLFATNRFQAPAMKAVELHATAVHTNRAPRALRGRRVHESGGRRDGRFADLLNAAVPRDVDAVARLMSDHGTAADPSFGTICTHSDYWYTTASVQLLPSARAMRISYSTACNAEYSTLTV